ncbi:hypothetical protein [Brevibacillus porteri]|nr:hypothetical protein [Brevibacillus porteri]MED1801857.1 hypothetical protein [Brevibacillus porteri]MED2745510.1 hypothetical protein [Brevibacillus porteri]MED2815745.1 hypothetical protein [Brevibacillus porteri]MED4899344.1 hypothetical protein [Brevibacillus porteri]
MMIRKVAILMIIALLVFVGIHQFWPGLFYPELPFSSVKKEVVFELIKQSPDHLVTVAQEDDFSWYGAQFEQGRAIDLFLDVMKKNGWTLIDQDGAGYFFSQSNNKIVVTTQMWTGKIMLFKVPAAVSLITK